MFSLLLLLVAISSIEAKHTSFDSLGFFHNATATVFAHASQSQKSLRSSKRPVIIKSKATEFFRIEFSNNKCNEPTAGVSVYSHPLSVCVPSLTYYYDYIYPNFSSEPNLEAMGKFHVWEKRLDEIYRFGYDDPLCLVPSGFSSVASGLRDGCTDVYSGSFSVFLDKTIHRPHPLSYIRKYYTMKDCIGPHILTYIPVDICIADPSSKSSMIHSCDGILRQYQDNEKCAGIPTELMWRYNNRASNECYVEFVDHGTSYPFELTSFGVVEKCGGH